MVLDYFCGEEMSETPRTNQAVDFSNDPSNLCNDFFLAR